MNDVRDKLEQRTSLGWMLLGLLGLQLAVAVPTWWVLDSYFGVDVPASLMFFGNDGWCDIATQGVGTHCFGDFHERFLIDRSQLLPWPNNLELSPIGPLLTETANALAVFLPARLVLSLFLLIYALCLMAPALWASRGMSWPPRLLIVGITGIATYPFLATMDRLHNVALTVPLILAFLVAMSAGNDRGVLLSILALTVIKPQYIMLYLVLIAHRRLRLALVGVLASVASCLALIVGAGGGDFGRVAQWLTAISSYGSGPVAERFSPVNISLARLAFLAAHGLESAPQVLFGSHFSVWTSVHPFLLFMQWCVLLLAATILGISGRRLPPIALGLAALVLSTFVLGEYVAGYYTALALPVCALFLRRTTTNEIHTSIDFVGEIDLWSQREERRTSMQWAVLVATTLSCSFLVIPWPSIHELGFSLDAFHRVSPLTPSLAAASWLVFLGVACGVAVNSVARGKATDITRWSQEPVEEISRRAR